MSGTLLTPPGLLGSTQPAAQPGAGLGQLYNAVNGQMQGGGIWGNQGMTQAPATPALQPLAGLPAGMQWYGPPGMTYNGPGATPVPQAPAAPPPTYDQWGRPQGGTAPAAVPSLNTGPGLPQGNVAQTQQSGGGLAGLYDQWGRPTPQSVALAAAQSQQAPQQQGFDASGIDPRTMAALQYSAPGLAALSALSGVPNPYAGVPRGGGAGLLGNAVAGGQGGEGGYGGNVTGGSTGALGAGGPPGGSGNAAVDAAAAASASAAAEQEQALGGMY